MTPYYVCPYTLDRMSPMQPVQMIQPMTSIPPQQMTNMPVQQMMQPLSPLYQPQGMMNMPLNMNDMNYMGNMSGIVSYISYSF